MKAIYLDYAAATALDSKVLAVMQPFLTDQFYNPSAIYLSAKAVRAELEAARAKVAACLGARSAEIVFTAGGTEANNLAIHGVMANYPEATVLTSSIEHESVLKPAEKYKHQQLAVNPKGLVDLDKLKKALTDGVVLVSIMFVNNEVGSVQPLRDIANIIAEVRKDRRRRGVELPILLHSDACQAANYFDLKVATRFGIDLMTINSGKIYGPKQCGALLVKAGLNLQPLISGGGQEWGLRSGTENVAACVGLAAALEIAQAKRVSESERVAALRDKLQAGLLADNPDIVVNGPSKNRSPNNLHLTFPGVDNERLIMQLDEFGVQVAAGSACSASSEQPSHVLAAIGLSDEAAQASLRLTLGRQTTSADISKVITSFKKALEL